MNEEVESNNQMVHFVYELLMYHVKPDDVDECVERANNMTYSKSLPNKYMANYAKDIVKKLEGIPKQVPILEKGSIKSEPGYHMMWFHPQGEEWTDMGGRSYEDVKEARKWQNMSPSPNAIIRNSDGKVVTLHMLEERFIDPEFEEILNNL